MAAGFREGLVEADGFRVRHLEAGRRTTTIRATLPGEARMSD